MKKSSFDLQHQNQHPESKIIAALERLAQAFRVLLWEESKEFSLTPLQVQTLIFLLYHSTQQSKVSSLAGEFNMSKATISDTVKALEQKGLIKKESDSNDWRSYSIRLTKKGKEIAEKTSFFSEEILAPVQRLHPDDKESMLCSLLAIIRHLNQAGIITIQRMCFNCVHYESSENGENHFCHLLNKPLRTTDLRIDCPEFTATVK
jgi:DNA-binding MarR family transcriptional regulator